MLVGKLQNAVRQGGGEEHVQALFRRGKAPEHVADVPDEAQVEHPVGLVQHHHLDAPEGKYPLLEVVDDPPRRPHQDIDALGEPAALFLVVRAAEGQAQPERQVLAQHFGIGMDLHRQFPGRGENQCPGAVVLRGDGLAVMQPGVERHQVGGRLAGPGLRLSGDVVPGKGERQGLFLNRRAAPESRVVDPRLKHLRQRQ